MRIDNTKDRILFLKYALPCASTLVKRGKTTQGYVEDLTSMVAEGKVPREKAENMFKIANAMCEDIAEKMDKKSVDAAVIRRYFLLEHSKVVDDRYELMGDFNPKDCKTYAGRVVNVRGVFAMVKTVRGIRRYRTIFARNIRKNDNVAVHFDFVIEKIPTSTAARMNTAWKNYAKK